MRTATSIRFTAGHLQAALSIARAFIEERVTIPILSCVHIKGTPGGSVTISGTDMESLVSVPVSAHFEGSFALACEAAQLRRILNTIPSETAVDLQFEADGESRISKAFLCWPGCRYRLMTYTAADFPFIASGIKKGEKPDLTFEPGEFRRALASVERAISREETRYYLNGAAVVNIDGINQLVATDRHRMAWGAFGAAETARLGKNGAPFDPIMPAPLVGRMIRARGIQPKALTFSHATSPPVVRVTCAGGVEIICKLIDGTFPDVLRVIPVPALSDHVISVDRQALRASVKRMMGAMPRGSRGIQFKFAQSALYISPSGVGDLQGTAERVCDIEGPSGKPLTIGFNGHYVIDILDHIQRGDAGPIVFRMRDHYSPVYIQGERVHCVLMPLRVDPEETPAEVMEGEPA